MIDFYTLVQFKKKKKIKIEVSRDHGLSFQSLLLYRLLIMEKTGNQKGAGLHWDIVLLCLINAISATFGGPWICAATVRGMNC